MKTCTKCDITKDFTSFAGSNRTKDKLQHKCRDCHTEYYQNNKVHLAAKMKQYAEENSEKLKEYIATYSKAWYQENKEKVSCQKKVYRSRNRAKYNALANKRRCAKLNATPKWLTPEHFAEIEKLYKTAEQLAIETSMSYHVDHIVPLQGKLVCGLHVPWNLQVLTAEENLRKSNNHGI